MQLSDYAEKYHCIRFARENGVLEMTLHSKGGPAKVGGLRSTACMPNWATPFWTSPRTPKPRSSSLPERVTAFSPTPSRSTFRRRARRRCGGGSMSRAWRCCENLLAIPVPMIAAVNGPALIHAELAVLCDIVLAASHAEFADLAHIPNGTVPGDGVHTVWPMLLGPNRGRYFLLTGERIGAEEARRVGVVGEVLPPGAVDAAGS